MPDDTSNPLVGSGAVGPTPTTPQAPQQAQNIPPAVQTDFTIPEVSSPIEIAPKVPAQKKEEVVITPAMTPESPVPASDPFSLQRAVNEQIAIEQGGTPVTTDPNAPAIITGSPTTPRIEIMPEHLMSPVHTLKTDISDVLASGNTSVARVAIQEESEKSKNETRTKLEKVLRVGIVILIISFVGSSLGILGYVIFKGRAPKTAGVVVEQGPLSLISSNTQSELDLTGADQSTARDKFVTLIKEKVGILRPHTIESVRLVRRVTEGTQTYVLEVPGSQVIRLAAGESSARFTSLLDTQSFFGLHTEITTHGFWILKTSAFQDSFAALLAWEKYMPANLFPLLTGEELPSDLVKLKWEDAVIKNTDVRVMRDSDSVIRMIYSFVGTTDTIFIGTNEAQFLEAFTRLKNPGSALQ